jgi:hypothetical protein
MNKSFLTLLFLFLTIKSAIAQVQSSTNYGDNKEAGNFKSINGLSTPYN